MKALRAAILITCVVAGWQLLFWWAGPGSLTSPLDTIGYTIQLLGSATFYPHLAETGQAFAVALAIAISFGILIGFSLGLYRFAGEVGEPVLVALYSIPKITLYPIVLLAFGIGMPAKIAFGALHGIVPVAILALSAVRNLNPVYARAARVMRMPAAQIAPPMFRYRGTLSSRAQNNHSVNAMPTRSRASGTSLIWARIARRPRSSSTGKAKADSITRSSEGFFSRMSAGPTTKWVERKSISLAFRSCSAFQSLK